MSQARELFDAGAAALGLLGGGKPNQAQALRYFTAASEADPLMCDAWLGRMLCGDGESPIVYRAWSARQNMHGEIVRLGVSPGSFMPKVDIGMGVVALEQPIFDRGVLTIALARMLVMGSPPDYQEAQDTLKEAPPTGLARWVRAAMYHRAQRFTDVIDTLNGHLGEFRDDRYLAQAANVALGIAYAHLGEFDPAERYLRDVEATAGEFPSARHSALWFLGLIARERGEETDAVALLRRLNAEAPSPQINGAITDPGFRLLTTTAEAIAARTDPWDPSSGPGAEELAGAAAAEKRAALLDEATEELDRQIGMTGLKEQIRTFRARMRMAEKRREMGLKTTKSANHMVFVGPPGTGKTTVARIIAKVLCGLGIVGTKNVVEVSGRELLGQYVGHSEENLRQALARAKNGVLFLDEAYALVQDRTSGVDPFGQAIVDELVKQLEDQRDSLVVIIAGYENDIERLLASNDGLRSRFAHRFRFETYSPEELAEIAAVMATDRDDIIDPPARDALLTACEKLAGATMNNRPAIDFYGNGRFVRKAIEAAADYRDLRNEEDPPEVLDEAAIMTIREPDMSAGLSKVLAEIESQAAAGGVH